MKITNSAVKLTLSISLLALIAGGCARWQDFTAYFNTYYNAQRLMKESEAEFEYHDEKKRVTPRVLIVDADLAASEKPTTGPPPFMTEFIITQQKRQPVSIKLDSIIIKGSKLMATRPKSNFLEGTLYLMGKSFFYRNEWLSSQLKCSEMLDRYPDGDMSPDGHLLLVKNLLVQKKFFAGKLMLSRTVDISWQKKRYDILSEAFRLEAELALFEDDYEGALRPYKQAVAQADDTELQAKWQLDLASLLYRMGKFEKAVVEFDKVHDYSPDYLTRFEADLYKSACLMRLDSFDMASEILTKLEEDGKFEEWLPFVQVQKMNVIRLKKDDKAALEAEKYADSAFATSPALIAYNYERAMDYYKKNEYGNARRYFARARVTRSPAFNSAQKMFFLLNQWEERRNFALPELERYRTYLNMQNDTTADSTKYPPNIDLLNSGVDNSLTSNREKDSSVVPDSAKSMIVVKDTVKSIVLQDPSTKKEVYTKSDLTKNTDSLSTTDSLKSLDIVNPNISVSDNAEESAKSEPLKDSAKSSPKPPDLVVSSSKDSLQAVLEQRLKDFREKRKQQQDSLKNADNRRMETPLPPAKGEPLTKNSIYTDSARYVLALALFELGRIHEQLKNHDSALFYFQLSVETAPLTNPLTSRFYHALSRKIRDKDPYTADSLLEVMVERFPLTEYGRDAMSQLGYTDAFIIDTVAELYASGSQLRRHGDFNFAIRQFKKIYYNYPKSKLAPRALYAVGWTFERNLLLFDSAFYYYQLLLQDYPDSEYSKDIQLTVTYYLALLSGEPLPDSLKTKEIKPYEPQRAIPGPFEMDPKMKQQMLEERAKANKGKPDDDLKLDDFMDPSRLLKKAEEMINQPEKMIKEIEMPSSPMDFFKKQEAPDSTGNGTNPPPPAPEEKKEPEK